MLTFHKLAIILFFISIAFSGSIFSLPLGELSGDVWPIFLPIIVLSLSLSGDLFVRKELVNCFFCLSIVVLLGGVFNFDSINNTDFKGRSGFERYLGQYILFFIMFTLLLLMTKAFSKLALTSTPEFISICFLTSLVPVVLVGSIEILWLILKLPLEGVLDSIGALFRNSDYVSYISRRARGTHFEAPALGMYLAFISPFVFLVKSKLNRFLLCVFIGFLIFASGSRVALLLCLFGVLVIGGSRKRNIVFLVSLFAAFIFVTLFLDLSSS
ncbi:hypothetical protein [Pseudoalteromonas piscicida]|uniref:hypothetical protein n=1 Tax=Pseudoalteromonas piscicida TaxID=43662 RepID=UPI0027E4AF6D|nr:hypothetical protein [Pseudoalteromonas piscicida]WMO14777.1 hypothetical protein NI376_03900 [Pseudoalteromonas piscicida]